MELISVVVPCFNEEEAIPYFYEEIIKVADIMKNKHSVDSEFIFVDDGSSDSTLSTIKEYAEQDKRVRYISFTRNFGTEAAMFAGFEKSTGAYIAIMDVDLQDPPELLE